MNPLKHIITIVQLIDRNVLKKKKIIHSYFYFVLPNFTE